MSMNYPVTTPFGQVAGYPLNNGFHSGIDYGYPMGTPVVVNGVTIGLSNNTGASTGSHLHVGKYQGGQVQDPGVGNGFSFNSAVVFDTGSDPINGNFVRLTADGALWNYLHLQRVLVIKGQVLKGGNMPDNSELADIRLGWLNQIGALVSVKGPIDGNNVAQVIANINNQAKQIDSLTALAEDRLKQINDLKKAGTGTYVPVTEQLFKKG